MQDLSTPDTSSSQTAVMQTTVPTETNIQPSETPHVPHNKRPLVVFLAVLLILFLLGATGIIGYQLGKKNTELVVTPTPIESPEPTTPAGSDIPEGVACTMDAKLCPDGSAVGRQGPNCEFAACPGEESQSSNEHFTQTYVSTTLKSSVKYPDSWYLTKCGLGEAALLNPNQKPECAGSPYEPIQFFSQSEIQTEQDLRNLLEPEHRVTLQPNTLSLKVPYKKYVIEKAEGQSSPGPDSYTLFVVSTPNGTFSLYVFDPSIESTAEQILSTFTVL